MADAVAFERVEEQYLTRLSHGLVAPQMAHVGAAIGKNQMDSARALLRALVPAAALAVHIPDRDRRGLQQRVNGKFRHACWPLKQVYVPIRSTSWRIDGPSGRDRRRKALAGLGQAATPALGFVPDFLDEP